jgi:hypothetical protein
MAVHRWGSEAGGTGHRSSGMSREMRRALRSAPVVPWVQIPEEETRRKSLIFSEWEQACLAVRDERQRRQDELVQRGVQPHAAKRQVFAELPLPAEPGSWTDV